MAKKERSQDTLIVPIRTLKISLPASLHGYTGKEFLQDNPRLVTLKYADFEREEFVKAFEDAERDADQILFIVLTLWWDSPYREHDFDSRIRMAMDDLGWYDGSTEHGKIIKFREANMEANVRGFVEAQSLRAWDLHNYHWRVSLLMEQELIDKIGKSDDEFDQKHIVAWKQSLSADLPVLTANQVALCERISNTRADITEKLVGRDIRAEAKRMKGSESSSLNI